MRVDVVDVDDDEMTAVLKPKSASSFSFSSSTSTSVDDSDASSEGEYEASGATLARIGGSPARRRRGRVGFAASFQSATKKIGCGRSSVVYRGTHVQSGKICAVKVFRCDDGLVAMQASREVQILKKIAAARASQSRESNSRVKGSVVNTDAMMTTRIRIWIWIWMRHMDSFNVSGLIATSSKT